MPHADLSITADAPQGMSSSSDGLCAVVEPRMVAALYVATAGAYFGMPGVDPWDEARDARKYAGPWPVVAHPPCDRWCQMAPVNQARYGHKVGDDGGTFAAALDAVRTFGGVLEHPAVSIAWRTFGLPKPPAAGGWVRTMCGGWTCHVEQRHYGHRARKATWLYAYGLTPPSLKWGKGAPPEAWISADRPRAELAALGIAQLGKREAKATPPEFRELLLSIARSAYDYETSPLATSAELRHHAAVLGAKPAAPGEARLSLQSHGEGIPQLPRSAQGA